MSLFKDQWMGDGQTPGIFCKGLPGFAEGKPSFPTGYSGNLLGTFLNFLGPPSITAMVNPSVMVGPPEGRLDHRGPSGGNGEANLSLFRSAEIFFDL